MFLAPAPPEPIHSSLLSFHLNTLPQNFVEWNTRNFHIHLKKKEGLPTLLALQKR